MAKRSYAGGAVTGLLTAPINATDMTISSDNLNGWPVGAADGPFAAVIERDTVREEKILCTSRNGNTLTVASRGYDGTTAQTHPAQVTIEHCITSIDVSEPNAHGVAAAGVHGLSGQDAVVGVAKVQTLTGKTMDGGVNTFTNIPRTASPQLQADIAAVQAEVDAEEVARANGDAARYTKAEADAAFTTDAEAATIANASVATHVAQPDPHAQYLTQAEGDAAFLTPAEGNALYALLANLTGFTKMHAGSANVTPNAQGKAVVTHGCGFDPDFMLFTVADSSAQLDATGGKVVNPESGSSTATIVNVRVYRNDTGNPVTTQVGLRWIGFKL